MKDLTRKQLDKVAEELGLNSKDYANKDEIIKAIEKKQEQPEQDVVEKQPWDGSFHTRS